MSWFCFTSFAVLMCFQFSWNYFGSGCQYAMHLSGLRLRWDHWLDLGIILNEEGAPPSRKESPAVSLKWRLFISQPAEVFFCNTHLRSRIELIVSFLPVLRLSGSKGNSLTFGPTTINHLLLIQHGFLFILFDHAAFLIGFFLEKCRQTKKPLSQLFVSYWWIYGTIVVPLRVWACKVGIVLLWNCKLANANIIQNELDHIKISFEYDLQWYAMFLVTHSS